MIPLLLLLLLLMLARCGESIELVVAKSMDVLVAVASALGPARGRLHLQLPIRLIAVSLYGRAIGLSSFIFTIIVPCIYLQYHLFCRTEQRHSDQSLTVPHTNPPPSPPNLENTSNDASSIQVVHSYELALHAHKNKYV